MDDNAPSTIGASQVVASLPEVHPTEVGAAPREDPDLEPIRLADQIAVPHSDPEFEGPRAVDRAGPLELRLRATHDQPVEARAMQVDVVRPVLEFLIASWDGRPFLILADKSEGRPATSRA